jgi:hypothetical protein
LVQSELKQQLWLHDNFDLWHTLVTKSRSFSSLVQAFVVLVQSLDQDKLPKWWLEEGSGWSKAYAVTMIQSEAALLFHLFVLDAAMTEFASGAITAPATLPGTRYGKFQNRYVLPEFDDLPFEDRVRITLQRATDVGLVPLDANDQAHGRWCCYCQDGGDLLCCELCHSVSHMACIQEPVLRQAPDKFVCDGCMRDVAELHRNGASAQT